MNLYVKICHCSEHMYTAGSNMLRLVVSLNRTCMVHCWDVDAVIIWINHITTNHHLYLIPIEFSH